MQQSLGPHVARCRRQTASQAVIHSSPSARPLSCSKPDSLHNTRDGAGPRPTVSSSQPGTVRSLKESKQVSALYLRPSARADLKYDSYRRRLMGQHFAVFR